MHIPQAEFHVGFPGQRQQMQNPVRRAADRCDRRSGILECLASENRVRPEVAFQQQPQSPANLQAFFAFGFVDEEIQLLDEAIIG